MLKPVGIVSLALIAACASSKGITKSGPASTQPTPKSSTPVPADGSRAAVPQPAVDPAVAYMLGLMPLKSTGIDPGVPGLIATSTGAPKVIELRDFSGEGRVPLTAFPAPTEREMRGAARIGRLTTSTTWYRGVFRELPLGRAPAGDVNGNGRNTDAFPVVVVKASDGWVAFLDTNLDGSFEDEMPLHDYRQGREMIALGTKPLTIVANFSESDSAPVLDLFFDTSGHGTHVAGIAAGYNLFDVAGFTGVAPGAQIIGLKIANNARGGVTVHGSMMRAIDYAARYAAQRNLPLVLNMSFGVGNEHEGRAVIDSIIDAFLLTHPEAVFAISAGNDGPGLSTVGFPGSADLALTVGASYPGVFAAAPQPGVPAARDVLGWFSSRGGELAKPDIVTPGVAFSSVPRWDIGNEIKGGTSMSSPHAAGLAACLVSALAQEGRRAVATDIAQALRTPGLDLQRACIERRHCRVSPQRVRRIAGQRRDLYRAPRGWPARRGVRAARGRAVAQCGRLGRRRAAHDTNRGHVQAKRLDGAGRLCRDGQRAQPTRYDRRSAIYARQHGHRADRPRDESLVRRTPPRGAERGATLLPPRGAGRRDIAGDGHTARLADAAGDGAAVRAQRRARTVGPRRYRSRPAAAGERGDHGARRRHRARRV
jgi:hypothetical protein